MEVIVVNSAEEQAAIVANAIVQLLREKDRPTLGLATGSSPQPVYDELIRRYESGEVTFENATACLLDEYLDLPPEHPELYRTFIRRVFIDKIDLPLDRLLGPDVLGTPPQDCASRYEAALQELGGIDLQLLGIGTDGHIGFNEPSSSLASRTRVKTLTASTRTDNARFFHGKLDDVPKHAVTQGIGTILEARHLILVATGPAKAKCVAQAVEGPLTAMVPASALQLHPHVTVVVDSDAAAELKLIDYYKDAVRDKPDWQGI
jgi:glucosamine-6-phosphate deaminase